VGLSAQPTRVALGDVVTNRRDQIEDREAAGIERVVGLDDLTPGDIRIRTWKTVGESPSFKTRFTSGQTLFGKRRAYLRKVALADFDGVCTQNILVLESKDPTVLLPELLPFLCNTDSFMEHAISTSEGSLFPNANWHAMAEYKFVLPTHAEQVKMTRALVAGQSMVDTLANAFQAIANVRAAWTTKWIHDAGVSGAGTEFTHGPLSAGWRLVPAEELSTDLITKGATPSSELTRNDTGIPFLKVYNLTFDGGLDFSVDPTYITPRGHAELQRSKVLPGDVLMNIVGPPLGKVSRVPASFPECNINQAIVRYRLPDSVLAEWFAVYLLSSSAQNWLLAHSKKTSGQRNLTLETCRALPVPVPPSGAMRETLAQTSRLASAAQLISERRELATNLSRRLAEAMLGERGL